MYIIYLFIFINLFICGCDELDFKYLNINMNKFNIEIPFCGLLANNENSYAQSY